MEGFWEFKIETVPERLLLNFYLDLLSRDISSKMIERKPRLDAFGQLPGPIKRGCRSHLSRKARKHGSEIYSLEGCLGRITGRERSLSQTEKLKSLVDALERSRCSGESMGGGGWRRAMEGVGVVH